MTPSALIIVKTKFKLEIASNVHQCNWPYVNTNHYVSNEQSTRQVLSVDRRIHRGIQSTELFSLEDTEPLRITDST